MELFLRKLKRLVRESEKGKEKSKFQLAPFLGQVDMPRGASCYLDECYLPQGEKTETSY